MSATNITNFFSNLKDRSITTCEGCNEKQVFERKYPSDLGYCFYRPHEGTYASETGVLYLTWGAYKADDMIILTVVEAIKDEARACNIDYSWKGSIKDRIVLKNLEKRYFERFS